MATTRIYTFGHGQHCPFTGKHLLDHYVTITAPTAAYCRQVMDKLFDGKWSADYLPGAPRLEAWLPQWTEHMRIVVPEAQPNERASVGSDLGGLIVGDTAVEQRDNAYAAYERDEAECPNAWHANDSVRSRCPTCREAD